uniref:Uncharacterized protein n=1 Tax=Opuntia streptacantha TaxID=393608 RepID=A0A7C8Z2U2_OPUST
MSKPVPRWPAVATTSVVGEAKATIERARSQGAWEGTETRSYLRERERERDTQRERQTERRRGGCGYGCRQLLHGGVTDSLAGKIGPGRSRGGGAGCGRGNRRLAVMVELGGVAD